MVALFTQCYINLELIIRIGISFVIGIGIFLGATAVYICNGCVIVIRIDNKL